MKAPCRIGLTALLAFPAHALAHPYEDPAVEGFDTLYVAVRPGGFLAQEQLNVLVAGDSKGGQEGVIKQDTKETWEYLSSQLTYGLPYALSFNVSLHYTFDDGTTTTPIGYDGAVTYAHANGVNSPNLGFARRFLDDRVRGLFIDGSLSGTPYAGTHKSASPGYPGNEINGDASVDANVTATTRMGYGEVAVGLDGVHEYPKVVDANPRPSADYHGAQTSYMNMAVRYRYHMAYDKYAGANVYGYGPRTYHSTYPQRDPPGWSVYHAYAYPQASGTFGYVFRSDMLVAFVLANSTHRGSYSSANGDPPWETQTTNTQAEVDYSVSF